MSVLGMRFTVLLLRCGGGILENPGLGPYIIGRSLPSVNPLCAGVHSPWAIAHRGASREFPENTRAAFDAALGVPIDGIELDLQLSADGVPVVWHDRTLSRAGGGGRRVAELALWELGRLALCGERILTLEEVLERYGGRSRLLLELKAREEPHAEERHLRLLRATLEAVEARGLEPSVLLLCCETRLLEEAHRTAPRVPTVLNLRSLPAPAAWTSLAQLFALSIDVRALTGGFVREAHARGKPVLTF